MIGSAIYNKLSNDSTITALVGTRIYPNFAKAKDGLFPQVVYETKNFAPEFSSSGSSQLASVDVTITCITDGNTPGAYGACDNIAQKVSDSLHNQQGAWGTITVQGAFLTDVGEDTVTDTESERILYYIKEVTFKIWYQTS